MSQYTYDYLVFIGRFQPFHTEHKSVIEQALKISDKVIVLVGSARQPRTIKNPWNYIERAGTIFDGLDLQGEDKKRVITAPIRDFLYNDNAWANYVQNTVSDCITRDGWRAGPTKVGIIGYDKDETSYYLKMFPQWGDPIPHQFNELLSATDIRHIYFEEMSPRYIKSTVPESVFKFMMDFKNKPEYTQLKKQHEVVKNYQKGYDNTPHKVQFITSDAVIVQSGHVLLVVRGAEPGEGLLALPGGYLNPKERIVDCLIRELREETKIKVPEPVLRGNIKAEKVFDHPNRDLRGRIVTHSYLIELPPGKLPPIKGGDDARSAHWVPFNQVDEEQMFADHYHIIDYYIGGLNKYRGD